jgi:hypothetical protein
LPPQSTGIGTPPPVVASVPMLVLAPVLPVLPESVVVCGSPLLPDVDPAVVPLVVAPAVVVPSGLPVVGSTVLALPLELPAVSPVLSVPAGSFEHATASRLAAIHIDVE